MLVDDLTSVLIVENFHDRLVILFKSVAIGLDSIIFSTVNRC